MTPQSAFGHMQVALEEAAAAGRRGEVPVGAVIAHATHGIVARAGNRRHELADPTAHAEILAIRAACAVIGRDRLIDFDLYTTLEPCTMCAAAISLARVRRLYYGASDPKGGGVEHGLRFYDQPTCHHKPDVYPGLGEIEAAALLREFFAGRRAL